MKSVLGMNLVYLSEKENVIFGLSLIISDLFSWLKHKSFLQVFIFSFHLIPLVIHEHVLVTKDR